MLFTNALTKLTSAWSAMFVCGEEVWRRRGRLAERWRQQNLDIYMGV